MRRAFAAVLSVLPCAGCFPAANTYTSARTLPRGVIQLLLAGDSFSGPETDGNGHTTGYDITPPYPTPGVRIGIADNVDFGVRAPGLVSLAGDVKVQLVRGRLDLAVDPGVQFYHYNYQSDSDTANTAVDDVVGNVFYLYAPLLVAYNVSRQVSLVASPGAAYVFGTGSGTGGGALGTLGLGVSLRVTPWLAIQPQVTAVSGFSSSSDLVLDEGIGFSFGQQAHFDDLPP